MKLNIKIETDKKVCNDILCRIIDFAAGYDAKALEIEGLDTCEPFYTDEEIENIVNMAMHVISVNRIPAIIINHNQL